MKNKIKKVRKPVKAVKKILEYYYMLPEETNVRVLKETLETAGVPEDAIEIWIQLDLMEVVLESDSLIFQNAADALEDPEDLAFLKEHEIKTVYQVSFDEQDCEAAAKSINILLEEKGGIFCSDTEDFMPIYKKNALFTYQ